MIYVDVFVPAAGNRYEFCFEENETVGDVIRQILLLVGETEDMKTEGSDFVMFRTATGDFLQKHLSVSAYRINNGEKLILL